jgi:ribosomal peptide maturation radical SAM protein 1
MYKISLVNMPFASLEMPSLALTQLKSVLEEQFGPQISVRILYLNQDIAHHLGMDLYSRITHSTEATMSGFGDWLFRQIAFDLPDNTAKYFSRFFYMPNAYFAKKKAMILEKRRGLDDVLSQIIAAYRLDEDDLVGFTSMFSQNVPSFALARQLKERKRNITIVMGGANCESPMGAEIAKNIEHIDFVFSGPALKSFPDFVKCQVQQAEEQSHQIRGVISRKNALARSAVNRIEVGEELDINQPVRLDYRSFLEGVERNFAPNTIRVQLGFETSRGCWWGERAHCTFCGLNGSTMSYRAMAPQKALEQFDSLFQYSSQCAYFFAVDNILPKSYLKEVLPHLRPPQNAKLFYEVKADLTREELKVLADAHVLEIQPGIEALATSTLKLMKKGTTAFQNIRFLHNCADFGIEPAWNLLIGFPGEPKSVYEKYVKDIPLLRHLPPPSGAYPVRFDRYSPYFVRAKEYGLDLGINEFYRHIYPYNERTLENLGYYFVDRNFGASYIAGSAEYLGALQTLIADWRQRWSAEPASRPRLLLRERDGRYRIFDSRGNSILEYELMAPQVELLRYLGIPRQVGDKADELKATYGIDLDKELAVLTGRGLVFEEQGRYLSLISVDASVSVNVLANGRESGHEVAPA